jgi:Peptidase A4 family
VRPPNRFNLHLVTRPRPRRRARALLFVATALAAWGAVSAGPAAAQAATDTSTNWGGYAVTKSHGTFRNVSATWVVPKNNCATHSPSYSATWVGLGGYIGSSPSLEQTGIDADCTSSRRARYSAWYELLPAGSMTIGVKIRAGDRIAAKVEVRGTRVTFRLRNKTSGASFSKKVTTSSPDVSSAEWIVEAPSFCDASDNCKVQPLTNFGTVSFSHARTTNRHGHAGGIVDRSWSTTKINLRTGGASKNPSDGAIASSLSSGGASFAITYQQQVARSSQRAKTFPKSLAH